MVIIRKGNQRLKTFEAQVTVLVLDYKEAAAFYCQHLGCVPAIDTNLGAIRYVVLRHRMATGLRLLLEKADLPAQEAVVGRQAGDFPFLVLPTDDAARDYQAFLDAGLRVRGGLIELPYGMQATVADPLGNWVCVSQDY